MNASNFDSFYALVEKQVGLQLDESKDYLVYSRLGELAKQAGFKGVEEFVKHLLSSPLSDAHTRAFDALMTKETSFFRDRAVFDALQTKIFPMLMDKRRADRTLRINCLAASTGQEVFSLCMMLKENFPELSQWNIYIQASDFSELALNYAKQGIYNQREVERGVPSDLLERYFTRLSNGGWELTPDLRKRVNFIRQNLLDEQMTYPKFDLVMMRNVLIYFSQEVKNNILAQVHKSLHPDGGVLMLGSTESIHANPLFQLVPMGRVTYYTHNQP
jgi:chemotaxis protein methyltransferase CheR